MLNGPIYVLVGIIGNSVHLATIPKMTNHLKHNVTKNGTMTTEITMEETKVIVRNTTLVVETYTSSKEKIYLNYLFKSIIFTSLYQ